MLSEKIRAQLEKAGLPRTGQVPFNPLLATNRRGEPVVVRRFPAEGPIRDQKGWVDQDGLIWVRDRAHADVPDHWDVQIGGGLDYFRVDDAGNRLP